MLSMTGFGDARVQTERFTVAVEVRAVNNRYLKIVTKCPDVYSALESEIEKTVREFVARGTINVFVRIDRAGVDSPYSIDRRVLETYWRQLGEMLPDLKPRSEPELSALLMLPGVITERDKSSVDVEADWHAIREALVASLKRFEIFRETEGRSMALDLQANAGIIATELEKVVAMAPLVVQEYRDRLLERVRDLVQGTATVEPADLIREVSIHADRCDIHEEITRLRSHLEQFAAFLKQKPSAGRKLDFLTQEMFREVNTIGSKANNVPIAHAVVEMKSAVEKIREVLQNVE